MFGVVCKLLAGLIIDSLIHWLIDWRDVIDVEVEWFPNGNVGGSADADVRAAVREWLSR